MEASTAGEVAALALTDAIVMPCWPAGCLLGAADTWRSPQVMYLPMPLLFACARLRTSPSSLGMLSTMLSADVACAN